MRADGGAGINAYEVRGGGAKTTRAELKVPSNTRRPGARRFFDPDTTEFPQNRLKYPNALHLSGAANQKAR